MNVDAARTRSPARGSYEEYHPYGSTAWWAGSSGLVSQKRYRFTGMERDDETGLQCHGVRYYAVWLGRWVSADPIGLGDGVNRYVYARNEPPLLSDASGMAPYSGNDIGTASFVAGQVSARQMLLQSGTLDLLRSLADDLIAGKISREEFDSGVRSQRGNIDDRLQAHGEYRGLGTAKASLSVEAKAWAAGRFLHGVYYTSFEEMPGVREQLDRVREAN